MGIKSNSWSDLLILTCPTVFSPHIHKLRQHARYGSHNTCLLNTFHVETPTISLKKAASSIVVIIIFNSVIG